MGTFVGEATMPFLSTAPLLQESPLIKIRSPFWGSSGGAKVLGKLSVPRHPTNLDNSRAMAYCARSRCEWGCLDIFFSPLSVLSSFSRSLADGPI